MKPQLLIENNCGSATWQLIEDKAGAPGQLVARGEFAKCDQPTANGRIYGRKLWEREIARLMPKIKKRKLFGEMDHPADGTTKLSRVTHVITNLWIEGDRVMGEALIANNRQGKDLRAIEEIGGTIGVSSRGFGTTSPDGKGNEVVNEDYKLKSFDFVADPADEDANPPFRAESTVDSQPEEEMFKTVEELRTKHPDLVAQIESKAKETAARPTDTSTKVQEAIKAEREKLASELKDQIAELKDEAMEEAIAKLMTDPEVGKAKLVLEKLKEVLRPHLTTEDSEEALGQKDEEIVKLKQRTTELETELATAKDEHDKLEKVALKVGHQLQIEKLLRDDPDAEQIRARLAGETFADLDQIKVKVESTRGALKKVRKEKAEKDEEIEQLRKDKSDLETALKKALRTTEAVGLKAYIATRLGNHPKAPQLRKLMEAKKFGSTDDVDQFLEAFNKENPPSDGFTRIRDRANGKNHGAGAAEGNDGGDPLIEDDTNTNSPDGKKKGDGSALDNVLGVPMEELRQRSGIEERPLTE